jgi:serine/threonine protein kinase
MIGERVAGKYELRRLLGEGAMGAVYEVVHVELGKRLAIKLIRPEFCESAEIVGRFRREARAASAVESEYIAQIFDFGRDEARGLYMVIEYLEGEDLESRLARERWIDDRDTATIGVQVARGLAKAHAAGIVHRDLKPANIFLTRRDDGSLLAKIVDFGISKFERPADADNGEPTLTAFGTTLGTPQYMSPEQCTGKLVLDARTDVWSLCAVLYEMVAGEPAIVGNEGHIAMMQRIVGQDVPPLAERADWVSRQLASVIDAGLARNRDVRIADASTLAARLLEARPEAGSHPALVAGTLRPTDVSELLPAFEEDPPATYAVSPSASETVTARGLAERLAASSCETLPPPRRPSEPPSSHPQSSRRGEEVEIFARRGDLQNELVALRRRNRR